MRFFLRLLEYDMSDISPEASVGEVVFKLDLTSIVTIVSYQLVRDLINL
jgi:hypothetical protein